MVIHAALLVLLAAVPAGPALAASTANVPESKPLLAGLPEGAGTRGPGEDIASAIPIASLPFMAVGTTAGRANDYDAACPYAGSTAPDVVYAFTPETDVNVTVSLCESSYDTKVYVFRDGPGSVVVCNDDAECGGSGWQSMLDHVDLAAGHTYYIVVDGYGTSSGEYRIAVLENGPCVLESPARLIVETEPPCRDGWDDSWNGGCNSTPRVFQSIPPSDATITLRGASGTYTTDGVGYRDTDWFRLDVEQQSTITVCGRAEFPLLMWVLRRGPGEGCSDLEHLARAAGTVCGDACATVTVEPGEHWLWVGPSVYSGVPCGKGYVVTIDGYTAPSTERLASWSTIKAIYR
ncbi:MAG: hypothetical protein FJY74_05560 [Candidatus Eisenbacteria bacterium]|nr:hypothetical protein [Candidatus Eisenbacteria bacterium]